ncbi:MAG: hypothetical protein MJY99_11150 [Fibrobacter sp.]|nr:hypothetical protein [Fibrobacter sp.]
MKKNKLALLAALLCFCSLFVGCGSADPVIVCGREWNPGSQIVADTASEFDLKDQLIVQFRYGTGFDFNTLKVSFYEGTIAQKQQLLWSHDARVTDKMNSYTLQGRTKHSDYMTARELTRHKTPGTVVIEVSTGDKILASKQITLVKK